ncbi:hypothetical protein M885DRAFT_568948 [Pelagophyceae sp. CCMP2097]|nr:hypothetical protein M885DRAFT_568948 [Pelagophyceae sp. CCMP2097]
MLHAVHDDAPNPQGRIRPSDVASPDYEKRLRVLEIVLSAVDAELPTIQPGHAVGCAVDNVDDRKARSHRVLDTNRATRRRVKAFVTLSAKGDIFKSNDWAKEEADVRGVSIVKNIHSCRASYCRKYSGHNRCRFPRLAYVRDELPSKVTADLDNALACEATRDRLRSATRRSWEKRLELDALDKVVVARGGDDDWDAVAVEYNKHANTAGWGDRQPSVLKHWWETRNARGEFVDAFSAAYNATIDLERGNNDLQFVDSPYGAAVYAGSYGAKDRDVDVSILSTSLFRNLPSLCEGACIVGGGREIGAQEAAYFLLKYPFVEAKYTNKTVSPLPEARLIANLATTDAEYLGYVPQKHCGLSFSEFVSHFEFPKTPRTPPAAAQHAEHPLVFKRIDDSNNALDTSITARHRGPRWVRHVATVETYEGLVAEAGLDALGVESYLELEERSTATHAALALAYLREDGFVSDELLSEFPLKFAEGIYRVSRKAAVVDMNPHVPLHLAAPTQSSQSKAWSCYAILLLHVPWPAASLASYVERPWPFKGDTLDFENEENGLEFIEGFEGEFVDAESKFIANTPRGWGDDMQTDDPIDGADMAFFKEESGIQVSILSRDELDARPTEQEKLQHRFTALNAEQQSFVAGSPADQFAS